jgi:general L-amino acid transport system permease protein
VTPRDGRRSRVKRVLGRTEQGLGLQEDVDIQRFASRPDEAGLSAVPAKEPRTPGEWIKENLFSSPFNSGLTVGSVALAGFVGYQIVDFVFREARWEVIDANIRGYMIGGYPLDEVWRIWATFYFVAALGGLTSGRSRAAINWTIGKTIAAVAAAAVVVVALLFTVELMLARVLALGLPTTAVAAWLVGRAFGERLKKPLRWMWILAFPLILAIQLAFDGPPPQEWEGFFFNLMAATVGIGFSFPIGIFLALGRRSELPVIRAFSVGFIELFRGVPLVGWLIFSKFVVVLLLAPNWDVPDTLRSLLAFTLFSSAYVGEIVRGGLQGVHWGQYEAAQALGLKRSRLLALIILPQALRSTIPAMISHFISLYKDTALFLAIQVDELLDTAVRSAASLDFIGTDREVLLFAAVVFWSVAFAMSRWSQRLEVRLGVGER